MIGTNIVSEAHILVNFQEKFFTMKIFPFKYEHLTRLRALLTGIILFFTPRKNRKQDLKHATCITRELHSINLDMNINFDKKCNLIEKQILPRSVSSLHPSSVFLGRSNLVYLGLFVLDISSSK